VITLTLGPRAFVEQREFGRYWPWRTGVHVALPVDSSEGSVRMSSARPSPVSIDIDCCSPFETIVVKTRSSVYELIVLRGCCGKVLVRGGEHFAEFCPALFVGSIRDGSIDWIKERAMTREHDGLPRQESTRTGAAFQGCDS
jgi:hypothetical protein